MSYAVLPSLWGPCMLFGAPLYGGPFFLEGLPESPKLMAGTVVGDGLVYHLVRTEEEASSCSSLHQQAFANCIWGMMLLLP